MTDNRDDKIIDMLNQILEQNETIMVQNEEIMEKIINISTPGKDFTSIDYDYDDE